MAKQLSSYKTGKRPEKEPRKPRPPKEHVPPVDHHHYGLPSLFGDTSAEWLEPRIEVSESNKSIRVSAELPGMAPDDIQVNISQDGYLTISGEKQHHYEEKDEESGTYFSERAYGTIQRTVPLPEELNYEDVSAKFENGVLSITIPKTENAKRRIKKIPITSK